MSELQQLQQLSPAHCVLLAVHYATESNITALRAVTALRHDALELALVLRILLTFLPEGADPPAYTAYVHELASASRTTGDDPAAAVDTAAVRELSASQARRKRRHLGLVELAHPLYKSDAELDALSLFVIHRAHRVDAQTGLLDLAAKVVVPFLGHSEHLRAWFISAVLPLCRLAYEYYPEDDTPSLEAFVQLRGKRAIDYQLSNLLRARRSGQDVDIAARDLRGVVGPWICGANERKRRKPSVEGRRASITALPAQEPDDWECLLGWLLHTSKNDFPLVASAFRTWDGPEDLDLGGYDEGRDYIDEENRGNLELRYAQTALACLYQVHKNDIESLHLAHSLLVRLSDLLNLESLPDLNADVDSLPMYDLSSTLITEFTTALVQDEHILRPDNAITRPNREPVRLIELFVFSAYLLSTLQQPLSIREVVRLYLRSDASEQIALLQKILHTLSSGSKKNDEQWKVIRSKVSWLWKWGAPSQDGDGPTPGIFGQVEINTVETEVLKALLESSHYPLIIQTYIQPASQTHPLPLSGVENAILKYALHHYDNASNGNRTRGGMKRAADIVAAFAGYFPSSPRFRRTQALLAATHSMSYYSLILQHGVPFQPVNIRVSADPLSLLRKLLSQNSRSYTHLDDLISIGQNLVVAMPSTIMNEDSAMGSLDPAAIEEKKVVAERRVIGMAIEAALEADDFETAYSYVVNRLSPPSPTISLAASTSSRRYSFGSYDSTRQDDEAEDVSWRAALLAGKHRFSPLSSSMWSQPSSTARPDLRRLEQRMELLSQALLLAPPSHLEEVLSVWQQCESEMTALLAEETEAEERFNDAADRKLPGAFMSETIAVQPRREIGRGAVEESPMGLFDVARGAAAAFSKSAFPLRGSNTAPRPESSDTRDDAGRVSMDLSDAGSIGSGGEERVRKRDYVANAVTGGLASGLGWVLGATPAQEGK
ncbi:Sec39 domain-containing protein [Massariosphaeria phaeospora]|uniref:Sec39 domain-containing protein n=1 Tax=Massariosphaeria phaeospora TaxID=100035 RepID=A0A7C8I512_9PLEO|nr:Sec39 domain-containing protein [Massariosphaeria phaeospora]